MPRFFISSTLFFFLAGLSVFISFCPAQEETVQEEHASAATSDQDFSNLETVKEILTGMINPFLSKLPPEPVKPEIVDPVVPPSAEGGIPEDFPEFPANSYNDPFSSNQSSVPSETVAVEPLIVDPPEVDLVGIIYDTSYPQALFNNHIVSIGDVIDGIKVVDISKSGILVEYKEKPFAYGIDDRKENK